MRRFVSVCIALTVLATLVSRARADVTLDATALQELQAWSEMYWYQVEHGTPAPGASTFRFTDPRLNSPLLSPVRGSVRALQALSDKLSLDLDAPPSDDLQTGGVSWLMLHDYMVCGKILTDYASDPGETWKHWEEIQTHGALWTLDGTVLKSVGLKPEPRSIPKDISQPEVEDAELHYAVEWLRTGSPLIAVNQDRSGARVTDALTGSTTYYEEFAVALHELVLSMGTALPTQESYLEVAWGKNMLSTVLVCVQIGHSYVLVDSMNGWVIGPFQEGSPFDARSLLALHDGYYQEGDDIEYVDETGRTVRGPVPIGGDYTPDQMAVGPLCYGCIACATAATISCGILCTADPSWDTPGEGWGMCMLKCYLDALGMSFDLVDVIRGNQQIDLDSLPSMVAMTACESVCGGCGGKVLRWLWKQFYGPKRGYLKPPLGWHPSASLCN